MIRKLLIPLAGAALMAGCVTTAPYGYRGDGDYYYGAPSVEYRYRSGYGDPYYGPYGPGLSVYGTYGYPYYRNPYYGYPYYGYPYYGYPTYTRPRTSPPTTTQPDVAPWRRAQELINRRRGTAVSPAPAPTASTLEPRMAQPRPEVREMLRPRMPSPMPAPSSGMQRDSGSAAGQLIRRARRDGMRED